MGKDGKLHPQIHRKRTPADRRIKKRGRKVVRKAKQTR